MSDISPAAGHLRKLAQDYRDAYLSMQKRYQEMTSSGDFLAELEQREARLLERFRRVQQEMLASLTGQELEKAMQLCGIFDQIRVINQFALQVLMGTDKSPE